MQIDGPVVTRLAGKCDHALALAEIVGAEKMGALGIGGHRGQKPARFLLGRLMPEDRQAESRLGNKEIASDEFEGRAGRIGTALVVAGNDGARALPFKHDLGRAQYVAGRNQPDRNAIYGLAAIGGGETPRAVGAIAHFHDLDGLMSGEHGAVARAGMIAMTMGDHRPVDGQMRIDVKLARLAKEPALGRIEPAFRTRFRHGSSYGVEAT